MKTQLINSLKSLTEFKTILYPTDTVWGLGCDATNAKAVDAVFKIKHRPETKSLIILVASYEMLKEYVEKIPKKAESILSEALKPTTVIYINPKGLAKNVVAQDNTVAIRIVNNGFAHDLIQQFGKPIVSTSANISGRPTAQSFQEIESVILESVDYVVDLPQYKGSKIPSRIVRVLTSGEIEILRA